MRKAIPPAVVLLGFFGCSNPEVVPLSDGVYLLARTDRAGIFGNAASLKAEVIRDANAFAAARGMVAIPVSTHETPMGSGPGQFAKFEYQFWLVSPDSPEAKTPQTLGPMPTVSIIKAENKIETKDTSPKENDIYTELIKLDDLRKRGIITEEEFLAQKKRLLEGK